MSINLDNVTNIMLGNTPVEQIADSQGNVLWSSAPVVLPNYFYMEDVSGADNTVKIKKFNTAAPDVTIYKSTDTTNWSLVGTTSINDLNIVVPANSKVYLKSTTNAYSTSSNNYNYFYTATGNFNIGGNIMSLLYGDNFVNKTTLSTRSFNKLFTTNTYVNISDLILPATTLANNCYYRMFRGCTRLNKIITYANDISATDCLTNWLDGVSATGDFYNLGGATYPSGVSGIPSGWTIHTSL